MKTDYDEEVLVLGDKRLDDYGIESGSTVTLSGAWLSRGAGGERLFSGHPKSDSQYCFVSTQIHKVEPSPVKAAAAAAQTVTREPSLGL